MGSVIFSEDEACYLQAMLRHLDKPPNIRDSWIFSGICFPERKIKPVGEFRVLVIGAKGVGKSLFLKEVSASFQSPSSILSLTTPPLINMKKVRNANGNAASASTEDCQHIIKIDSKHYKVDALELPFVDIHSPEAMEQLSNTMAMTEAAILVYDVTDIASLTYLKSIANAFYDALHQTEATETKKKTMFPFAMSRTTTTLSVVAKRPYNFLLLGTKTDVPASEREVSCIEGHKAAGEFFGPDGVAGGASIHFMEVSSRTGDQIDSAFPLLGREILHSRREKLRLHQLPRRLREEQREQQQEQDRVGREPRQWRTRGGGVGIGAFDDDWGCCDFAFDDYDVDDGGDDFGYDSLMMMDDTNTNGDEGSTGGTSAALSSSMRRRWGALKATFSMSIFKKDMKGFK